MINQLSRARRRFLYPHEIAIPIHHSSYTTVSFSQSVWEFFREEAYFPGIYQSGPLFGRRIGQTFHMEYAAPSGGPVCDEGLNKPFRINSRYVLGFSDALRVVDSEIDWIGHWLILPHGKLPNLKEIDHYAQQAVELGLLDHDHPLIFIGSRCSEIEVSSFNYDNKVGVVLLITNCSGL